MHGVLQSPVVAHPVLEAPRHHGTPPSMQNICGSGRGPPERQLSQAMHMLLAGGASTAACGRSSQQPAWSRSGGSPPPPATTTTQVRGVSDTRRPSIPQPTMDNDVRHMSCALPRTQSTTTTRHESLPYTRPGNNMQSAASHQPQATPCNQIHGACFLPIMPHHWQCHQSL
jgi:hypothetical protein